MKPLETVLGFCGYGFRNAGDDAFMAVLADQLLRRRQGREVRVTSPYLPVGCEGRGTDPIYRGMGTWRGAPLVRLAARARGLDAAVLFGGSVLHEGCHFQRESAKWRVLRLLNPGLRTAAIGVSVGPFQSEVQARRMVELLQPMDYLSVRDEPSRELLESWGLSRPVERHFDPAVLLAELPQAALEPRAAVGAGRSTPVLGLAPCHVDRYRGGDPEADARRCRRIVEGLAPLLRRRAVRLKLFTFNGHPAQGDQDAVARIRSGLEASGSVEVVPYEADPLGILRSVGTCDAFLAMRLHAAVFAYTKGVPLAILGYHPKCFGFAGEIGLDSAQVLDADVFTPADLCETLDRLMSAPLPPRLGVRDAIGSAQRSLDGFLGAARSAAETGERRGATRPRESSPRFERWGRAA